jgi:hypothetical protein
MKKPAALIFLNSSFALRTSNFSSRKINRADFSALSVDLHQWMIIDRAESCSSGAFGAEYS